MANQCPSYLDKSASRSLGRNLCPPNPAGVQPRKSSFLSQLPDGEFRDRSFGTDVRVSTSFVDIHENLVHETTCPRNSTLEASVEADDTSAGTTRTLRVRGHAAVMRWVWGGVAKLSRRLGCRYRSGWYASTPSFKKKGGDVCESEGIGILSTQCSRPHSATSLAS